MAESAVDSYNSSSSHSSSSNRELRRLGCRLGSMQLSHFLKLGLIIFVLKENRWQQGRRNEGLQVQDDDDDALRDGRRGNGGAEAAATAGAGTGAGDRIGVE